MQFAEKAREVEKWFKDNGHQAQGSIFIDGFLGLNNEEKETLKLKQKYEHDAIREHWRVIQESEVVLILNYDKNNIPNYIGGNSFLEMGFAYILNKPIYLLNPIPAMPFYETEIIAMKPVILDGDLTKIIPF
ncbi:MAG: Maf-like protein [Candidatus Magasanikbacteria bacterium GW2011_GWC2_37_14]|uniref:Maf-like protein n=1 Tax=Candidatus Magasanikbacteria bacterium GW2011_GWC2_37_14 TaxID=1619046 RepID=A0A0G0IVQ5_9BACT|nr:MAG: Maf-like protein [Candidatus Magasanikbacteria bacterium GW2011_GWC2_37_14]